QLFAIVINTMYPFDIRSYSDAYLAMRQLPHLVRQLLGAAGQSRMTLLIMLLAVLFSQYRRRRVWIVVLLGWVVITTIHVMHERTEMFLLLFAAAFLYHHLVRPIRMYLAVGGVVVGI